MWWWEMLFKKQLDFLVSRTFIEERFGIVDLTFNLNEQSACYS